MFQMDNQETHISTGRRFLIYHLPALLYAAAILTVSSMSNLRSPEIRMLAFDKIAHLIEFAIFAFLIFRSISHWGHRPNLSKTLLFSALFVLFFALLDETYQYFIPGRQSDPLDVLADISGAAVVLTLLGVRRHRLNRKQNNQG